jgi:signal transduction histidine kinase
LTHFSHTIEDDIVAVGQIPVVSSLLEVVCRTTGMGFAAIARVTDTKWVACAVKDDINFGLKPGSELVLETTICHEIRQNQRSVIIDHVDNDPQFAKHHTPLMYGFQSYISVPIMLKSGQFFGTLCAIDPNPHRLNTVETVGMFNLFADLISFHLSSIEDLAASEALLLEERKTAELREQFIAILGHDLRNPVSAVSNVAQLLLRMPLDERTTRLANILKDSSFRMKGLIENVMDFASGRMGGGIILTRTDDDIQQTINHIVAELDMVYPGRQIETHFNITQPVNHDGRRMEQLFSNILANALTHGKKEASVKVEASTNNNEFTIAISNNGPQIPDAAITSLFKPFSKGINKQGQQGLGLGLYIASQIALAHGGSIGVVSTNDETCFTLKMPLTS